jgi:alkaline phosphatase D
LADYRLRFAAYRSDPDLRLLHQLFPMVAMWDDHESSNDSWVGGAENHQPESEGPWEGRKSASIRAYREWMPVGDKMWESYEIGDLATLFRPETRLSGRSKQFRFDELLRAETDVDAALARFRDGPWQDPARTMMGVEQEQWLGAGLRESVRRGAKWQLLAQEVILGRTELPPEAAKWDKPDALPEARRRTANQLAAGKLGLPFNLDNWGGYPAARKRLLRSAMEAEANLVVLSGDSHNAWAFDLAEDGTAAGVEIAGHSVTSPGWGDNLPNVPTAELERALVARNPELKWAELGHRGYVTIELTPDRATAEWLFLNGVRERSTRIAASRRMTAIRNARRFTGQDGRRG